MPGEQFLIEDPFTDEETTLCQLHEESTGELALFIMSGILNLNDQIILLLTSAFPEDRESKTQSYHVLKVVSKNKVELTEESFNKTIYPPVEAALQIDPYENQKLLAQYFGPFREYDPNVKLKLSMRPD